MKYLTILLTVFALKSCGSSEQLATKSTIQDMTLSGAYTIISINNQKVNNELTIEFNSAENKASGFTGCNRYFGSYTLKDNTITFGPMASTRKFCMGEAGEVESIYLEALSKVNKYTILDTKLQLFDGDNILIEAEFKKQSSNLDKYTISYSAISRGTFQSYEFKKGVITYSINRNDNPSTYKCSKEDLDKIEKHLNSINLKTIPELKAPSKAHQYDGAVSANLTVDDSENSYKTNTFDHGNPPEQIKELINLILALTESM